VRQKLGRTAGGDRQTGVLLHALIAAGWRLLFFSRRTVRAVHAGLPLFRRFIAPLLLEKHLYLLYACSSAVTPISLERVALAFQPPRGGRRVNSASTLE